MALKSERHHWWPVCVSAHWEDAARGVHWILPDGEVRKSRARNFGVIGNGHHIKLSASRGEETPWDSSFEEIFAHADDRFPAVIDWLSSLTSPVPEASARLQERFVPQPAPKPMLDDLVEGLVSLAVRSPMNREAAVGVAESLRGPLPEPERNAIIALNMQRCQRALVDAIGNRGRFVVLFSPEREFVFGDGFFHNIRSPMQTVNSLKIVVALTPEIAVGFWIPPQYTPEPRLHSLVVNANEAEAFNEAVQVYASNAIFYRAHKPEVSDAFRSGQHMMYTDSNNSMDRLLTSMPGTRSNLGFI